MPPSLSSIRPEGRWLSANKEWLSLSPIHPHGPSHPSPFLQGPMNLSPRTIPSTLCWSWSFQANYTSSLLHTYKDATHTSILLLFQTLSHIKYLNLAWFTSTSCSNSHRQALHILCRLLQTQSRNNRMSDGMGNTTLKSLKVWIFLNIKIKRMKKKTG